MLASTVQFSRYGRFLFVIAACPHEASRSTVNRPVRFGHPIPQDPTACLMISFSPRPFHSVQDGCTWSRDRSITSTLMFHPWALPPRCIRPRRALDAFLEGKIVRCSLERRWSSRTFRYGYLVTTSSQSPVPPSTAPSLAG